MADKTEIDGLDEEAENSYIKAGRIACSIFSFAKKIVKPNAPILEIAEKIESEIIKLGGRVAFPATISCDEIAAHNSPLWQDKTIAFGLVKVDFGVTINDFISDNALSFDLSPEQKHAVLINAAESALNNSIKFIKEAKRNGSEASLGEIGNRIQEAITLAGFSPVRNLSGHELRQYMVHSGLTIPNYNNESKTELQDGAYAIEPFATSGVGVVQDGSPSGIYQLEHVKPARDSFTREMFKFIQEEYKTLPFSARWLIKKFGMRALLSLQTLEQQGCLHQFPQLVEKSRMPVSQAEKTILISGKKVIVLGEE